MLGFRLKGTQRTFYADAADLYKRAESKDAENQNGVSVKPRGRSVRHGMLA